MKTIATLQPVEFLRAINHIRKEVAGPLKELNILETLKQSPSLDGTETEDEKARKIREQTSKNLDVLCDKLLEEKAEETIKLLDLLVIKEEGDENATGLDYAVCAMELITNKQVVDFLSSMAQSGLMNMAG